MEQLVAGRRFLALTLLAVLLLSDLAAMAAAEFGLEAAAAENGVLETAQAVILFVAFAVFGVAAIGFRGPARMFAFACSLVCLLMGLREIDLTGDSALALYLGSPAFRVHETIAVAAIALPYAWFRRRHFPEFVGYAWRLDAWPFLLALGFFFLADMAEQLHKTGADGGWGQFFEEVFELNGFAVLLAIGVLSAVRAFVPRK